MRPGQARLIEALRARFPAWTVHPEGEDDARLMLGTFDIYVSFNQGHKFTASIELNEPRVWGHASPEDAIAALSAKLDAIRLDLNVLIPESQ